MEQPILHLLATGYLALLSTYHVGTGLVSFLLPDQAMRFYKRAYGCDPAERRHLMIILRPWGALAVFAGAAGFGALAEPSCRTWVESALLLLLCMRIGYRVWLHRDLHEISGIPPGRNSISIAVLLLGVILLAFDLFVGVRPPT